MATPGSVPRDAAGRRGALRVYVGMAAGVGKTYAMLEDARARVADGEDIVIGWLEPHGRAETIAMAEGLEVVPAREVSHRGLVLREMDVEAVCARAPTIALVDELAHTNAPGSSTPLRADEVERILERGIGVFSTVNIQHLESLNDHVQELTGVRVRETIPDQVLLEADEVVLVDLPPAVLRERLRAGKIYPHQRVDAALLNFFTEANLATLREVSLREVAGAVGARMLLHPTPGADESPPSAVLGERILVVAHPRPGAQRLVRVAWRAAERVGAELEVVCPMPPRGAEGAAQHRLLRELSTTLGAHMREVSARELEAEVLRVAADERVTRIVLEMPRRRGPIARARGGLLDALITRAQGVNIMLIAPLPPGPGERRR